MSNNTVHLKENTDHISSYENRKITVKNLFLITSFFSRRETVVRLKACTYSICTIIQNRIESWISTMHFLFF